MGRNEEAIREFSETVRLRSEDAEAWFRLGAVLTNARRYEEATQAFSGALRSKPDFAAAQRGMENAMKASQSKP